MKTTIYINSILLDRLKHASAILKISNDELISIILSKIINKNPFKVKLYKAVKYQDSL